MTDGIGNAYIRLASSSPASNTAITTADYDQVGTTNLAPDLNTSSVTLNTYNNWALNATGTATINGFGVTKFVLRHGNDIVNSEPSSTGYNGINGITWADQTGTTQDPKLVVEHTDNGNDAPTPPTSLLVEGESNPEYVSDSTPEFSAIYNDLDAGDSATHYRTPGFNIKLLCLSAIGTPAPPRWGPRRRVIGAPIFPTAVRLWLNNRRTTGASNLATMMEQQVLGRLPLRPLPIPQKAGPVWTTGRKRRFPEYKYVDDEWWQVTDKFGTVYTFGAASTTRQHKANQATTTFKWMLQEVRDLNDNYISYEYFKDNGQIYPYKITYTGSGSTDGIYEVEFARTLQPRHRDHDRHRLPGQNVLQNLGNIRKSKWGTGAQLRA